MTYLLRKNRNKIYKRKLSYFDLITSITFCFQFTFSYFKESISVLLQMSSLYSIIYTTRMPCEMLKLQKYLTDTCIFQTHKHTRYPSLVKQWLNLHR